MSEPTQVPYLIKDARVTITLDKVQITNLQAALAHLLADRSQEEIALVKTKIMEKHQMLPWEVASIAVVSVLDSIRKAAQDQGQLEYRDLEDVLTQGQ